MSSTLLTQKINNKRIQIKGGQLIIEMTRLVQKGNNTVKSLFFPESLEILNTTFSLLPP